MSALEAVEIFAHDGDDEKTKLRLPGSGGGAEFFSSIKKKADLRCGKDT